MISLMHVVVDTQTAGSCSFRLTENEQEEIAWGREGERGGETGRDGVLPGPLFTGKY